MTPLGLRLVNAFQRDFPLVARPFEVLAGHAGTSSATVLNTLEALQADGTVSRIGAVFRPNTIGASTLAAMAVPPDRLARVAAIVSAAPGVNHNYEREHAINLWFVATARDATQLEAGLVELEQASSLPVLRLPLVEPYHIDLGFDLEHPAEASRTTQTWSAEGAPATLDERDWTLVSALERGLPLEERPYAHLAEQVGTDEADVLERLRAWQARGWIQRFGVIVRHHELGFRANAMCVWDVPDEEVTRLGRALAGEAAVTLCYRRRRAPPDWSFNLYCMFHGQERARVLEALAGLRERHGLDRFPGAVLFSLRRFKQTGARYAAREEASIGCA